LLLVDEEQRPLRWIRREDLAGPTPRTEEIGEPVGEQLRTDDTLFHALELMVESASGQTIVVDAKGAYAGVVDMTHLNKAIRRAQMEARLHYEELEANA